MAQTAITINIKGADKLRRALRNPKFVQGPASEFVRVSAFKIQREAALAAPSDRGHLRGSITPAFDKGGLRARVGTNKKYAPFMEFGTKPHWPPWSGPKGLPLQRWARRHGFPGGTTGAFLVARSIARKGTKPRRFMQKGIKRSEGFIRQRFNVLQRGIAAGFERSA